jgi:pimeloyl-ACP methyl ester carboxylesterase
MTHLRNLLLAVLSHDTAGLLLAVLWGAGVAGVALAIGGPLRTPLLLLAGLGAALLALAAARHLWVLARARRAHTPPGQLVDMGGYRMHVWAEGQPQPGRPSVVWFAGGHASGYALHHLHRALVGSTRSVLIDRPGTGFSNTGPFPRSTAREADEVVLALQKAGEQGPFVWAGHSFGGLLVANVARRYPQLVHSVVLLDPTPLETIVFGPRLAALRSMQRDAWLGGVLQLFGISLKARREAQMNQTPAYQKTTAALHAVLGPAALAARAVEANAGHYFAQASIYEELTPKGVAAAGWHTVVYDGDLGTLPLWLVAPRDTQDSGVASLPEAQNGSAANAQRMHRFFAATRERYLAASSQAHRVVAPAGAGHNFVYELPDWTVAVMRHIICCEPLPPQATEAPAP